MTTRIPKPQEHSELMTDMMRELVDAFIRNGTAGLRGALLLVLHMHNTWNKQRELYDAQEASRTAAKRSSHRKPRAA